MERLALIMIFLNPLPPRPIFSTAVKETLFLLSSWWMFVEPSKIIDAFTILMHQFNLPRLNSKGM